VSNEEFEIPRHGNAGVAFIGVELKDATIVIVSVFVGIVVGWQTGPLGYLGVPAAGFFLNKVYIDWRKNTLPGQTRLQLFKAGLAGYGRGFKSADVLFVGDAAVLYPGRREAHSPVLATAATRPAPAPTHTKRHPAAVPVRRANAEEALHGN
jgi:hypothetical protein